MGKACSMGRDRWRDRCNRHRLLLGWLGNGRNGRKDGGGKRSGGYRPSIYATLRCQGGTAAGPLCVAKAEQQPEQLVLLKAERDWKRDAFVIKAGWVDNVSEKYQKRVADACASIVVEGMKAK
jgi:hypothetical protein